MKPKKEEISEILTKLSVLKKLPILKNESLDIKEFNKIPLVNRIKEELKIKGIKNNEHLGKLGFVPASMILRF